MRIENIINSTMEEDLDPVTRKSIDDYHRRYYQVGKINMVIESELPIEDTTFSPKFRLFEVEEKGEDHVIIRHHFFLPDLHLRDLGQEVYKHPPWTVFTKDNFLIYTGIIPDGYDCTGHQMVISNHDHTRVRIFHPYKSLFLKGNLHSISLLPTDQIILARVLADREGCYLHSGGVILNGKGFLFAGHSQAGKSTMVTMLNDVAEILCDDRIILRRWPDGFKIYGSWSHGDISEISPKSIPLYGIYFLKKAKENRLERIEDRQEIIKNILAFLVKPLVTVDWWEKVLFLVEKISKEVPCYWLYFDKSGKVLDILENS